MNPMFRHITINGVVFVGLPTPTLRLGERIRKDITITEEKPVHEIGGRLSNVENHRSGRKRRNLEEWRRNKLFGPSDRIRTRRGHATAGKETVACNLA